MIDTPMRPEDLIPAFMDTLDELNEARSLSPNADPADFSRVSDALAALRVLGLEVATIGRILFLAESGLYMVVSDLRGVGVSKKVFAYRFSYWRRQ